jgi:hypothetical protein
MCEFRGKTWLALAIVLVLGMAYGYLSAIRNQNPYYPVPGADEIPNEKRANAWHWEPSPLWLPSYLLCKIPKNGFAVTYTKSGYLFRSCADLYLYRFSSTVLGGALGLILAIIIINIKKTKQRKKQIDSVEPLVPQ